MDSDDKMFDQKDKFEIVSLSFVSSCQVSAPQSSYVSPVFSLAPISPSTPLPLLVLYLFPPSPPPHRI